MSRCRAISLVASGGLGRLLEEQRGNCQRAADSMAAAHADEMAKLEEMNQKLEFLIANRGGGGGGGGGVWTLRE